MSYYMYANKTSARIPKSKIDTAFSALKKNAEYVLGYARDCDREAFPKAKGLEELLCDGLGLVAWTCEKGAVHLKLYGFQIDDDQYYAFCRVTEVLRKYMPKKLKMSVVGEDHRPHELRYYEGSKDWGYSK